MFFCFESFSEEQRSLQEMLLIRNIEYVSLALKYYVDGWNDLCLYLAKSLQENGCFRSGIIQHELIHVLGKFHYI